MNRISFYISIEYITRSKLYLISLIAILIASCSPTPKYISPDYARPNQLAILPTINQTTDINGGIVLRNLFFQELNKKYYINIMDNLATDTALNEAGITDGGQLTTISNDELFILLKVDGLLYIELNECNYQTVGISESRHVAARFKMYTVPSGLIWEDEREVKYGKSAIESAFAFINDPTKTLKNSGKDLKKQLGDKALKMWLLEHELLPEMTEIVTTTLKTLP